MSFPPSPLSSDTAYASGITRRRSIRLSLGQAPLNADRSCTIPNALAERWNRLGGGASGELWRSSSMLAQQPNFSACLSNTRIQSLFYSLYCRSAGISLPWFRPTRLHSTHPSAPATSDGQSPPVCSSVTSESQSSDPEFDPPALRLPKEPTVIAVSIVGHADYRE